MKNIFFLIVGVVFVLFSFFLFSKSPANHLVQIKIGSIPLQVEIADSEGERILGLSGKKELKVGNGLLFIFEDVSYHGIWMKDMNFPIDIIWIDENFEVLGVEKEVSPESFPRIFYPPTPARYVLELPAGFADSHGIDTGLKVYFE